jgi:beta-lactam-binding protein with PASTA domain
VPKLKGKTLAQARKLLTRAHCRLGEVKRPHARKRRALVVGKQTPAAGRSMPNGAKVALKLVFKPRTRHR